MSSPTAEPPLTAHTSADWLAALAPVAGTLEAMDAFLAGEVAAGRGYLPAREQVLRAFSRPLADVRVLIVGQDPYPTPGHPVGLSFAVAPQVRPLPRSLHNIYAELRDDLGIAPAPHGDLTPWFEQGVLLLNRVLTVAPGRPAAHRRQWLGAGDRTGDRCAGRARRRAGRRPLGQGRPDPGPAAGGVPHLTSAHPSPLSARSGFFGSRPFSRVNTMLAEQGAAPVDWSL